MDEKTIESVFQIAPLLLKILSSLESGNKDEQQKLSALVAQRIHEGRKILDSLPGGDLTAEQQQQLLEFYQQRLQRKK